MVIRVIEPNLLLSFASHLASFVAMANYETVMILYEAMQVSPSETPEDIKRTLLNKEKFKGLQYEFSIDKDGDSWRPLIPHQIKNGAFQKIDMAE